MTSRRARPVRTALLALALLGVSACGSGRETDAAPPSAAGATTVTAATSVVTAPGPSAIAGTIPMATAVPDTAAPSPTTTAARTTTTSSSAAPAPTDPADIDPGTLPQTRARPPNEGPLLDAHVQDLWHAIVTDDAASAMPFFFPRSAYLTVKAIADPAGDYERRLVADFTEDIHALHVRLGAEPGRAGLGAFTVPATAQWIDPGVEHNAIGYWRVYSATLGCTIGGRPAAFPIASMISWRGEWYVVHLSSIR